jgi:hypothetical protein
MLLTDYTRCFGDEKVILFLQDNSYTKKTIVYRIKKGEKEKVVAVMRNY